MEIAQLGSSRSFSIQDLHNPRLDEMPRAYLKKKKYRQWCQK